MHKTPGTGAFHLSSRARDPKALTTGLTSLGREDSQGLHRSLTANQNQRQKGGRKDPIQSRTHEEAKKGGSARRETGEDNKTWTAEKRNWEGNIVH